MTKSKLLEWKNKIVVILNEYCYRDEPCGKKAQPILKELKGSIENEIDKWIEYPTDGTAWEENDGTIQRFEGT